LSWRRISLSGIRIIGSAAALKLFPASRSFIRFAVTAVAVLSRSLQRASCSLLTLRFSCFIASPMKLHRDGFPRSVLANPCNKITPIGRPVSCWVRSILILFCDRRNTKRRPDALTQLGVSREFCIGSSSSPRGGGIRTPDAARAPIPESLDSHISCVGPDAAKSQHEHMIVVFRIHQIAFLMNRLVQVRSVERVGQRQPSFRRSGSRVSGSGEPCMATVPARASQARRTFQAERSDAPRLLRAHPG